MDEYMNNLLAKYKQYFMSCGLLTYPEEPMIIVKGKGSLLQDIEGNSYIDFAVGHSAAIYGHCHPKIVSAVKKQVEKLIHCPTDIHQIPVIELSEKLAKINQLDLKKSFFLNSGSEAVECALHLARRHAQKFEIVALYGAFHGRSYGARSATSWVNYKRGLGPYLPGVIHMPSYYCYRCFLEKEYPSCDIQCARMLEDVMKYQTTGSVAAFIVEPIQGTAGNIVPPKEYFEVIKDILDEHDILFIDDEIITGLGRTGKLFGIEHYNVNPDIVTLSKTLAGGIPIGATIAREDVANSYKLGDYFSTFGGNPVSCAASLAAIDVLFEEKLIQHANDLGKYLMKSLNDLAEEHEIIGDVRGKGLLIGVELVKDRESKEPAVEEARKLKYETKRRGLILAAGVGWLGNCIRVNPPLTISRKEIDKAIEIIDESLKSL